MTYRMQITIGPEAKTALERLAKAQGQRLASVTATWLEVSAAGIHEYAGRFEEIAEKVFRVPDWNRPAPAPQPARVSPQAWKPGDVETGEIERD